MDIGHGISRLGATIGFGFLQSAPPALQPRAAADMLPVIRASITAPLGATPSRRTAVLSHLTIYRGSQAATMASSRVAAVPYRERFSGETRRREQVTCLECLE
jgi:hypothetical protein